MLIKSISLAQNQKLKKNQKVCQTVCVATLKTRFGFDDRKQNYQYDQMHHSAILSEN